MNNQTKQPKHYKLILVVLIIIALVALFADRCNADELPPVMTRYDHPSPLRHGGYTTESADRAWVAVDDSVYAIMAGSRVSILLEDGQQISAWIWDSGYLDGHCVEQVNGDCRPILFDLHERLWLWGSDTSVGIRAWRVDTEDNWWIEL